VALAAQRIREAQTDAKHGVKQRSLPQEH